MIAISPRLFPINLTPEMIPRDAFTLENVSQFYIPDCQDWNFNEVKRINVLAQLFFHEFFSHCLFSDGRINFTQIESWFNLSDYPTLDSSGRLAIDLFKNLHVIGYDNLNRLVEERGQCPYCHRQIKKLVSCPLWEIKLHYQNCEIDWDKERSNLSSPIEKTISTNRARSLSRCHEFSLIHLIILIEIAFLERDPQDVDITEGIISKFLTYDNEYTTRILESIRSEMCIDRARAWISQLKERPDLNTLRGDLYQFLCDPRCPSDLYQPHAYIDYVLQNYQHIPQLEEVIMMCDARFRTQDPKIRCVTPTLPSIMPINEGPCLPIRYLLLKTIFLCTSLYFLFTILTTFFKTRFFFVEDI